MNFQKKAKPEGESHWGVRLRLPRSVLPTQVPMATGAAGRALLAHMPGLFKYLQIREFNFDFK